MRHAVGRELIVEDLGVGVGDNGILLPVADHGGHRFGGHVAGRRRRHHRGRGLLGGLFCEGLAAERAEHKDHLILGVKRHQILIPQRGGAAVGENADGTNGGGGLPGVRVHQRDVRPGGITDRHKLYDVQTGPCGDAFYFGEGGGDVVQNLVNADGPEQRITVVHCRHGNAVLQAILHTLRVVGLLIPGDPAAAVDIENERRIARNALRQPEVQALADGVRAVDQIPEFGGSGRRRG